MADETVAVLAERIAALDRLVHEAFATSRREVDTALVAQQKRFEGINEWKGALQDQRSAFATKTELNVFSQQSAQDRANLHDLYQELRVGQQARATRAEVDVITDLLSDKITALQGSVSRLLVTLLSSLVVTTIAALLWDLTHRQ